MTTALVLLAQGAEEIESISAIDILRRGGIETTIATFNQDSLQVKCAHGTIISADTFLEKITTEFDVVVVPGGYDGSINCGASELVKNLLQKQFAAKKLIAAICAAPGFVLAKHGILSKDIKATGYPGTHQDIPNYEPNGVVVDKEHLVITGKGPAYAQDFAFAIVEFLQGADIAKQVKDGMLVNL